jgi:hypothetical protein
MSPLAWAVFIGLTLCGCPLLARRTKDRVLLALGGVALLSTSAFSTGVTRWVEAEVKSVQPTVDAFTRSLVTIVSTTTAVPTTTSVAPGQ